MIEKTLSFIRGWSIIDKREIKKTVNDRLNRVIKDRDESALVNEQN